MATKFDNIDTEVTESETVTAGAIALLTSLSQAIKDAGTDQAKLDAITARLDANNAALAKAVIDNTIASGEAQS